MIKIGKRIISKDSKPLIVAEIGINHFGSLKVAKKIVDEAKKNNVEAIKVQIHIPEEEMNFAAKKIKPGNSNLSIFEVIRKTPSVKAILNITSDKCYENNEIDIGYTEKDPMGGFDPYSSSKGCSELISSAYRNSFFHNSGIALATARAGNVIGGGDWAKDRIIPDAVRAFQNNKPLLVRNPKATRPWQHVLEPLSGYILLCQRLIESPRDFSEGWNFGPSFDDVSTVSKVVDILSRNWGDGASWTNDNRYHPHEASLLKLDCSKANTRLNWIPIWHLDRALTETLKWYKSWIDNKDMNQFSLFQIDYYQQEYNKYE